MPAGPGRTLSGPMTTGATVMDSLLADAASFDRLAPDGVAGARTRSRHAPWRRRLVLLAIVPLLGLAALKGYDAWRASLLYETSDDAFVDAHITQLGPQVSGPVKQILVKDNEEVAAGQLLVEIDPRDYENRLAQARAQLATSVAQRKQAEAQLELQKANIDQAAANLRATAADDVQARQDQARYAALSANVVTRQQVDHANAAATSTTAKVEAGKHAVLAATAQLAVTRAQLEAAKATVDQSQTQVENATLQLSYTKIEAPVAGRVTKRSVEVGNYAVVGQAMLSIVPKTVWVTANFKETQLADMKPGQRVDIHVDAFPQVRFEGHVDSFQTGTGAAFSVLPAENATGNYVKITQRVPVKIVFDGAQSELQRLAPGMSVEPKVGVR